MSWISDAIFGSEVKVYKRTSWKCLLTLNDEHHHKEVCMYITCIYYVKTIMNKLWLNIFQILCLAAIYYHGCLTPFFMYSFTRQSNCSHGIQYCHAVTLISIIFNMACWSPCGNTGFTSSAVDGTVVLWNITGATMRMERESLEWDPGRQ